MNKLISLIFFALFPVLALAADSTTTISFSPPPSDYSISFLGSIFGVVDGVLHGSGSQILGNMFSIFNAAVLALGGIIIMYTLLVSTVNTAHEGQMLGQKWSSIWVPVRSTIGLSLLIPKASGYCLMQIFIMWVVVQGVGAADKVWEAALSYLNRGGVIIQVPLNPLSSEVAGNGAILSGAANMLAGQVCMEGLQSILENQRTGYLKSKEKNSGPCAGTPSDSMKPFCDTPVPDFVDSVNFINAQNSDPSNPKPAVSMPNFDASSLYYSLNGICGSIQWNGFTAGQFTGGQSNTPATNSNLPSYLTPSEKTTVLQSRALALQQMYMDLAAIAQIMVNNDPDLNRSTDVNGTSSNYTSVAIQQYGLPYTNAAVPCSNVGDTCTNWGPDSSKSSSPLFNGTELQGAVSDYNTIMQPTISLINQAGQTNTAAAERQFIQNAASQGWLMAGSYYIQLAMLNSANATNTNDYSHSTDQNSGLTSTFNLSTFKTLCESGQNNNSNILCTWLNNDPTKIKQLSGLFDGSTIPVTPAITLMPSQSQSTPTLTGGPGSSTVFGYINNAAVVALPSQPGTQGPKFLTPNNAVAQPDLLQMPGDPDIECGLLHPLGCIAEGLYYFFKYIMQFFVDAISKLINTLIIKCLQMPLTVIDQVFINAAQIIETPNANPVIALANMGVEYINTANEMWIELIVLAITCAIIPIVGIIVFALLILVAPLLFSWLATMLSIGFITAYYIPFLPFMIFSFGVIAWLMAVIEAMVAGPIVALGVTHPEGEGAFGKGEQAIMILLNVFLRPAMMIMGYIAGIALSYVAVWIINAGFTNVLTFIQGTPPPPPTPNGHSSFYNFFHDNQPISNWWDYHPRQNQPLQGYNSGGYTNWAGLYGCFFCILIYTSMYLTAVQKSFTLITMLPDKILRWIGGQPEGIGQESSQWSEEGKKQIGEAGGATAKAAQQIDKQLSGQAQKYLGKGINAIKGGGKSVDVEATKGSDKK